MKIPIYFNARFLTQAVTGVQRYAEEFVYALDSLIENQVINTEEYQLIMLSPKNIKREINVKHIQLQIVGKLSGHLWEQLELPFYSAKGLLVNLCNTGPVLKWRQVVAIHDLAIKRHPEAFSSLFRIWYLVLFNILTRSSKLVITNSNFSKQELMEVFPLRQEKVKVSYLGCEHVLRVNSNEDIISKLNLDNKQYILSVSTLNPLKNFQLTISALDVLKDQNVYLVIAGGVNDNIFEPAKLETNRNIIYAGYVDEPELRALYEKAICFVYPSIYEGFGLPPLEAMSLGCPVITSTAASLPEICGDSALYCDPSDYYSLADQIKRVMSDGKLRNTLINKGKERARAFRWQACVKQIFDAVKKVLDDENRNRS